jgi:hypothetical protein
VVFISLFPLESNLCYKYSSLLKVHLLSAYPHSVSVSVPDWLVAHSNPGPHVLTPDPAEADLILFAETYDGLDPYFFEVVRHPVFRRFPDKCVLYHINDTAHTLCRTISPSVESTHPNARSRRSFSYVVRVHENTARSSVPAFSHPGKYLFSFIGDPATHPIRQELLKLKHPQAILRSASGISAMAMDTQTRAAFHRRFIEETLDSLFVLCPRGLGASSMRLFETMELGRAPVVVADSWLPVAHLPWNEFALFVKEKDVEQIPSLLESHRDQAVAMGIRARAVWDQHFSPAHVLESLISTAQDLLGQPYGAREKWQDFRELSHPKHWRNIVGWCRRRLKTAP